MTDSIKQVVALDIGGTKIASALVTVGTDDKPRVEHLEQIPTDAQEGGEAVLQRAIDSAQRVIAAVQTKEHIIGIGVSSAGVINPQTGDVTYANELMPGWGGTALGAALEKACALPVRVLNDVHAHALGEARWGGGLGKGSCLVVAVGTGIGGAFVNQGHILLGAHNEAGHIGHVSCTDAVGIACSCGATGHLEPVAAGPGIIKRYLALGGNPKTEDGSPLDGAIIDQRANAGDEPAQWAEQRAGHALGEVLGSMVNMFDPDCVILSGSVIQCGDHWHDAVRRGWSESAMPPVADTPLVNGELGGNAPLIGAAEHVIKSAYQEFEEV